MVSRENRFVIFRITHKLFVCMVWLVEKLLSVVFKSRMGCIHTSLAEPALIVWSNVCPSLSGHLIVPDRCPLMEWTNDSKHWWWQAFVSTGPIRACTCGKVHLRLALCVWTCLPAGGDLHRQQLAGCYFLICTAAGTEMCRLKSMMLPGP